MPTAYTQFINEGKKRECLEEIKYHKEAHEKEIEHTLKANSWIKALYDSVEG